jgi:hypothetical protein
MSYLSVVIDRAAVGEIMSNHGDKSLEDLVNDDGEWKTPELEKEFNDLSDHIFDETKEHIIDALTEIV